VYSDIKEKYLHNISSYVTVVCV